MLKKHNSARELSVSRRIDTLAGCSNLIHLYPIPYNLPQVSVFIGLAGIHLPVFITCIGSLRTL